MNKTTALVYHPCVLILARTPNRSLPALWCSFILQSPDSGLLGTGSESKSAVDRPTLMAPIWLFFKGFHPIKLGLIDQQALPLDGSHGDINHPLPSIRMASLRKSNGDSVHVI